MCRQITNVSLFVFDKEPDEEIVDEVTTREPDVPEEVSEEIAEETLATAVGMDEGRRRQPGC